MSTIASPRASVTLSSRRTSTSTDAAGAERSSTAGGASRRNRAALRDYYNLAANNAALANSSTTSLNTSVLAATTSRASIDNVSRTSTSDDLSDAPSVLDAADFDPQSYAANLLRTSSLHNIWRAEAQLSSSIRALDAEKKALVYDNYARLITATDTIKRMRASFEPLAPATESLEDEVGRIATRAGELATVLRADGGVRDGEAIRGRERQRDTVRCVLRAPERLKNLIEQGKKSEAEREWERVKRLLDGWGSVGGLQDVRDRCAAAMEKADGD